MKKTLFIATGWVMYYPGGLLLTAILQMVCPLPKSGPIEPHCAAFWITWLIFCLACLPWALKSFEQAGRWLWLKLIPAWRPA